MSDYIKHNLMVQSTVDSTNITNNNIYLTRDTHELYYDVDDMRICVSTLIQVVSAAELATILAPISNKLYFVKETNKLYIYNNDWVELTGVDLSDYYVKSEVDDLVENIDTSIDVIISDDEPTGDIAEGTIWIDNTDGSTLVDLSNYYTKTEVNGLIPDVSDFITIDDVPVTDLSGYVTTTTLADSMAGKQDILSGTTTQIVGFDSSGNAIAIDKSNITVDLTNYYDKDEVDAKIISSNILNIRIPSDDDNNALTCYIEISESSDFSDSIAINSTTHYSCMETIIDGTVSAVTTSGITHYSYNGILVVDLTDVSGYVCNKPYYVRARFHDGTTQGIWLSTQFIGCGYLESNSVTVSTDTSTDVDLSNYYTKSEVDGLIPNVSGYVTTSVYNAYVSNTDETLSSHSDSITLINENLAINYYTATVIDNKITTLSGNIPTNVSDLTNDSGYTTLTEVYSNVYKKTEVDTKLNSYVLTTALSNYYTSAQVDTLLNNLDTGGSDTGTITETECILSIAIPTDDDDTLTCYIELSTSIEFTDVIQLNTTDHASIMEAIVDGTGLSVPNTIPNYMYNGTLIVNLHQYPNFDCTQSYYVRARFHDGTTQGIWYSTKFKYYGYIESHTTVTNTSSEITVVVSDTEPTGTIAEGTIWIQE